ncbi:MAG: hypothetical protein WC861_06165 [Candidatus Micrarchaeia archaeon]|jgi:predicted nucleic acid-binding protein
MAKLSGQSIVCDSSSLISLTDSCFVHAIYFLKKKFGGKFIIPPSVERECVEQPMHIRNYALHAIRLKRAIAENMIDVVEAKGQPEAAPKGKMALADKGATDRGAEEIRFIANNIFSAEGTPLKLLHAGEADVLALALELGVDNILMDERTTRMLVEDPEALRQHLESELGRQIGINDEKMSAFSRATRRLRFFRSTELLLLAYEKGYFADYGELEREAVEASLYKLKYSGCAIGFGEIGEYARKHIREQ